MPFHLSMLLEKYLKKRKWGNIINKSTSLANSCMVFKNTSVTGRNSTSSKRFFNSVLQASMVSKLNVNSNDALRQSLINQGILLVVAEFLLQSWRRCKIAVWVTYLKTDISLYLQESLSISGTYRLFDRCFFTARV